MAKAKEEGKAGGGDRSEKIKKPEVRCPMDREPLEDKGGTYKCPLCGYEITPRELERIIEVRE